MSTATLPSAVALSRQSVDERIRFLEADLVRKCANLAIVLAEASRAVQMNSQSPHAPDVPGAFGIVQGAGAAIDRVGAELRAFYEFRGWLIQIARDA